MEELPIDSYEQLEFWRETFSQMGQLLNCVIKILGYQMVGEGLDGMVFVRIKMVS